MRSMKIVMKYYCTECSVTEGVKGYSKTAAAGSARVGSHRCQ